MTLTFGSAGRQYVNFRSCFSISGPSKRVAARWTERSSRSWRRRPRIHLGLFVHRVEGDPPGLYALARDPAKLAATVSCGQDIAGDGAFSLGMIGDYMASLATYGAAFYRNLFWEAGMVVQVLYLEAEEAGIRSTGIGCYFDDPVHEVFGITSPAWQSFYDFTVGGPVEDVPLTTLSPYHRDPER